MNSLDETQPFGQVRGSVAGIRYEQNGKLFNARKEEITADGELVSASTTEAAPADTAEPKTGARSPRKAPAKKATKAAPEGVRSMKDVAAEDSGQ